MEKVNLPSFVRVLMIAEVMENCNGHPNQALHDKSIVRIIDPIVDGCFIVETDKIEPKLASDQPFTATVQRLEVPTKITVIMGPQNYSVEAELLVDGTAFCVKACGDLQSGIAAFGGTVSEAVSNFKRSLQKDTPQTFGIIGE